MKITLICVGKLKEKYWTDAVKEYVKRIQRFACVDIIEISEEQCIDNPSKAIINNVKDKEGIRILQKIPDRDFCIAMDVKGKKLDSESFADKLEQITIGGKSNIIFIIGGSYGLSQHCLNRADYSMSMSDLTFPHQMARVILLEQIYRCMKINAGEKYHK